MIDGFINIYKEQGFTSFDVVAKLRGILKQKKIGHTGTLDPMAEGVLLVCLGSATKMCDLLTEKNKTYTCTMLLGKTSDTEDVTGVMTDVTDVYPDEKTVRAAVMSFVGDYMQIPPMYSAIKVNGKKLYELARAGQVIEREPRSVTIHGITIQSVELPRVTFDVSCSKGTYIRSLCRDIGEKLGCGAVMEKLIRTEVKGSQQTSLCRIFQSSIYQQRVRSFLQMAINSLRIHLWKIRYTGTHTSRCTMRTGDLQHCMNTAMRRGSMCRSRCFR